MIMINNLIVESSAIKYLSDETQSTIENEVSKFVGIFFFREH
jgi:hypothetical protein